MGGINHQRIYYCFTNVRAIPFYQSFQYAYEPHENRKLKWGWALKPKLFGHMGKFMEIFTFPAFSQLFLMFFLVVP